LTSSLTPTPTTTLTSTPTSEPTTTPTPTTTNTPTPSPGAGVSPAYLLIEPQSIAGNIGTYMNGVGATFFGFTNNVPPSSNFDIEAYLDYFTANAGTGGVPAIITQTIPQTTTGGNDSFNNAIIQYNFLTTEILAGTVTENAWYTWVIPDESIGGISSGNRQTVIDLSFGTGPTTFSSKNTSSSVYTFTVTNPGGAFAVGTYRLYTTFNDPSFNLNNSLTTIYFKGNTVA
jgi:hypothetical protein